MNPVAYLKSDLYYDEIKMCRILDWSTGFILTISCTSRKIISKPRNYLYKQGCWKRVPTPSPDYDEKKHLKDPGLIQWFHFNNFLWFLWSEESNADLYYDEKKHLEDLKLIRWVHFNNLLDIIKLFWEMQLYRQIDYFKVANI